MRLLLGPGDALTVEKKGGWVVIDESGEKKDVEWKVFSRLMSRSVGDEIISPPPSSFGDGTIRLGRGG
jgi:hypothetical protein